MKQFFYALAFCSILGCAANSSNVEYGVGYDREAEQLQRKEAVKQELNSRDAAMQDSKTRSDIDKAIERERPK